MWNKNQHFLIFLFKMFKEKTVKNRGVILFFLVISLYLTYSLTWLLNFYFWETVKKTNFLWATLEK